MRGKYINIKIFQPDEALKTRITNAALDQFLQLGIRYITMRRIVDPLGISTKTVYKYFNDKEDLLRHCLIKHYTLLSRDYFEMEKNIVNPLIILSLGWEKALNLDFGVNHIFYHDLNYYYPDIQDSVLKKIFKKSKSLQIRLIQDGISEGYLRKDIIPEMILEVFDILYVSITRTRHFEKFKRKPEVILDQTIHNYLKGLCTEKGLKELNLHISNYKS